MKTISTISIFFIIYLCFLQTLKGQEKESFKIENYKERVQAALISSKKEKKIIKVSKGHELYVDQNKLRSLLRMPNFDSKKPDTYTIQPIKAKLLTGERLKELRNKINYMSIFPDFLRGRD